MTKNDVKEIQSLKQAKGRKERGIFAVEGNKLVEELLNSQFRVNNIFATEQWVEKNPVLANKIADYEVIMPKQMEQISNFVTPPGVFATAMMPKYKIEPKDTENQLIDGQPPASGAAASPEPDLLRSRMDVTLSLPTYVSGKWPSHCMA